MKVKLPGKFSGQEIVDAFKEASSFTESTNVRWQSSEFIGEIQYEPTPSLQAIQSMGVNVSRLLLKRQGFLNKKAWRDDHRYRFTLQPVYFSRQYEEVDVKISRKLSVRYFDVEPKDPQFETIRPSFETMISFFYALLKKNAQ